MSYTPRVLKIFIALSSVLATGFLLGGVTARAETDPVSLVDPTVGTKPNGGTQYPGAALPFSLVKLSPDTANPSTAGYDPTQPIVGFSHTHISGTSSTAFAGQILVRPQTGLLDVSLPASPKADEAASPGYYTVSLARDRVKAELTLLERCGVHRYTFPEKGSRRILVEVSATLNNSKKPEPSSICIGSEARFISDREIEGKAEFIGGYTKFEYTMYFVARFDQVPISVGSWQGQAVQPKVDMVSGGKGEHDGLYAEFAENAASVGLRVGISYTSIGNARRNLQASDRLTFEQVKIRAQEVWRAHLNRIQVTGGSEPQRRQFYTALYHSALTPTDATGDQGPWPTSEPAYWDIYTIWDTFRCAYPLNTLIHPDRQSGLIRSLLDVYKQTGWLRDGWAYQKIGFSLQGGTDADIVIADAVVKKLGGFDLPLAYEAVKKNATVPASSKIYPTSGRAAPYFELGFVPAKFPFDERGATDKNPYQTAVSSTLEFAYNDFAVAQVAEAVGQQADAEKFRQRSRNTFNLFNPETKFFWGKSATGEWLLGFDPSRKSGGPYSTYYEGTPWQYRFTVPHDVQGLINRLGGKEAFIAVLDEYFDGGHETHDNEPTFLTPWLYDYAGRPDKVADRVRATLLKDYHLSPAGYPGDEDNGAMSSWYVFGAMGFYPNAGQDVYLLGSPIFEKTVIRLGDNGKIFTVTAKNLTDTNRYVQSATLNSKPWEQAWFRHKDIIVGGELILLMGPKPTTWGLRTPPPSLSSPQ